MGNEKGERQGYIIKCQFCEDEFPVNSQVFSSNDEVPCPWCTASVNLKNAVIGEIKSESEFITWVITKGKLERKELEDLGLIGSCWGEENYNSLIAEMKAKREKLKK
jgi:hypothetical protein